MVGIHNRAGGSLVGESQDSLAFEEFYRILFLWGGGEGPLGTSRVETRKVLGFFWGSCRDNIERCWVSGRMGLRVGEFRSVSRGLDCGSVLRFSKTFSTLRVGCKGSPLFGNRGDGSLTGGSEGGDISSLRRIRSIFRCVARFGNIRGSFGGTSHVIL